MAKIQGELWSCEYPNCRHRWMAQDVVPPKRCAKCKKSNWHRTLTAAEIIRKSTWQDQIVEAIKPYLKDQVKASIAHEILEAKRCKGEYVAEALPEASTPVPPMSQAVGLRTDKCGFPKNDYETGFRGYCGKIAGHKLDHGQWQRGEPLDD